MKKSFCFTLMILSLTACGNGIDYLLKPIDETDLRIAIGKVQAVSGKNAATSTDAITQLNASLLGMTDKVDRCDVGEGFPFYPLAAYLANLLTATIDDSAYECLWGIGRMCLANKFIAHTGLMDKADVKRVGPVSLGVKTA